VDEHVRCENAHDLRVIMQTFGSKARYDDEPWDHGHTGPPTGVTPRQTPPDTFREAATSDIRSSDCNISLGAAPIRAALSTPGPSSFSSR
jgi:hypothetical protein